MFHIISNLHFEFYKNSKIFFEKNPNIEISAKTNPQSNLILAGDIGYIFTNKKRPKQFGPPKINKNFIELLTKFKEFFKNVIYVTGNHEYYQCQRHKITPEYVDTTIRNICNKLNITFLQCESIIIDNIHIHGCTLFSKVNFQDFHNLNDSFNIGSHQEILNIHFQHLNFLKNLKFGDVTMGDRHIIITHHLPIKLYETLSSGYFTDIIKDIQELGNINYWICGHVHQPIYQIVDNTRIVSSPIGYPGELKKYTPLKIEI